MSSAWLSPSRSHFWLLNTSKSSTSKTLRFFSTAGACFSCAGGGVGGCSNGSCARAGTLDVLRRTVTRTSAPNVGRERNPNRAILDLLQWRRALGTALDPNMRCALIDAACLFDRET